MTPVEAMARLIAKNDPEEYEPGGVFDDIARAALQALSENISDEMVEAAHAEYWRARGGRKSKTAMRDAIRAALQAAKER